MCECHDYMQLTCTAAIPTNECKILSKIVSSLFVSILMMSTPRGRKTVSHFFIALSKTGNLIRSAPFGINKYIERVKYNHFYFQRLKRNQHIPMPGHCDPIPENTNQIGLAVPI